MWLGSMEANDVVEFTMTLPKGTAEVKITGQEIVYWTPWS